jgi:hypothetical protein
MSTLSPPTISNVKTSKAGSKSKGKSRKHSKGFSLTGKSAMALVRPAIGTAIFAGLTGYQQGANGKETVTVPLINKDVDVRLLSAGVLAGLGYFKPAIIAKHTALIHEGAQGALSAWSADYTYGQGVKMGTPKGSTGTSGVGAFWQSKEKRLENKKEKAQAFAIKHDLDSAPAGGGAGGGRLGIDTPPVGMPTPVYVPGAGWTSAPRLYQTVRHGGQRQVVPAGRKYLG